MDKQLRMITGEIIVMSEMSKQAKMQLLNFVKEEASDAQVKVLLMDGRIVQLDKQAEEIVNDRFNTHHIKEFVDPVSLAFGAGTAVAAVAVAGAIGKLSKMAYKKVIEKSHKLCGKIPDRNKRKLCIQKAKQDAAKKKLQVLRSQMSKCNKAVDPQRCMALVKNMAKTQEKTGG